MGSGAKIAAGVIGAVILAAAAAAVLLVRGNDARVKEIGEREMGCPAADIEIVDSFQGDTSESYELRGCGKAGSLLCSSPDFECSFAPTN